MVGRTNKFKTFSLHLNDNSVCDDVTAGGRLLYVLAVSKGMLDCQCYGKLPIRMLLSNFFVNR